MLSTDQVRTSSYQGLGLRGGKGLPHLYGINRNGDHFPRKSALNSFNLRVNHDKARTFCRVLHKEGARSVGDLLPDSLHFLGLMEVDFRRSGEVDNKSQIAVRKHPVNG